MVPAEGSRLGPPTEDELESMAKFWATEEMNSSRGWEHEKEIDYEELYKKSEMRRGRELEESQNSGTVSMYHHYTVEPLNDGTCWESISQPFILSKHINML